MTGSVPPAEVAFHPSEGNDARELYLLCDNHEDEMTALRAKGVECSEVEEPPWGSVTMIRLPGGGTVGLYQPKHPTALEIR